jgi:hypothetical protein
MNDFLSLLSQAACLVEGAYPGSIFCGADGKPAQGTASSEAEVNVWRFGFDGPRQQGKWTSVSLEYSNGEFGSPTFHDEPIFGDHVIVPPHWPIKMALTKAIQLKNEAGYTLPFRFVNLRWPLSPGNVEPYYIFTDTNGLRVFVGVESGSVTQRSLEGGGQLRLCTGQGLVYKAYTRPYAPDAPTSPPVLIVLASCYYPTNPWELFLQPDPSSENRFRFKLMEKPPALFSHIQMFYAAGRSTELGHSDLPEEATIVDAYGEHRVKVQELC